MPCTTRWPPSGAGTGSDVDDLVRLLHGLLVVLHDDEGVAQVRQAPQGVQQLAVVLLVQADGGFIQDVHDPHQRRSDLGRQTDALGFAAGQRGGSPRQGKIIETDFDKERQPRLDLLEDEPRDGHFLFGELVRQLFRKGQSIPDGHFRKGDDVDAAHGDRQDLGLEPSPLALAAGVDGHKAFDALAYALGLGVAQPVFDVVAETRQGVRPVGDGTVPTLVVVGDLTAVRAVPDLVLKLLRHVLIGNRSIASVILRQLPVHRLVDTGEFDHGIGVLQGAFVDGLVRVLHHQVGVHVGDKAKAVALRTGAEGRVEGKAAGLQFADGDAVIRTGQLRGEQFFFGLVSGLHDAAHEAVPLRDRQLRGFRDAALLALSYDDAVHHDVDGVLKGLCQLDLVFVEILDLAVHPHADEAFSFDTLQDLLVRALLFPDDRSQQRKPGAFAEGHQLLHDLVHALAGDLPAADGAMGNADAGVEQTQIVVNFGDRSHGGSGVLGRRLLIDGDGGRQAFDGIHVGLIHLAQELPGVGRQTFHVASLPFRIDRVERQRGLSAAGEPRYDDHLISGDRYVDIFQVMGARPG